MNFLGTCALIGKLRGNIVRYSHGIRWQQNGLFKLSFCGEFGPRNSRNKTKKNAIPTNTKIQQGMGLEFFQFSKQYVNRFACCCQPAKLLTITSKRHDIPPPHETECGCYSFLVETFITFERNSVTRGVFGLLVFDVSISRYFWLTTIWYWK